MNNVKVLAYIIAEVSRQGHAFWEFDEEAGVRMPDPDGAQRTIWMLKAWGYEKNLDSVPWIDLREIEMLGRIVEPGVNTNGFRKCGVKVGRRICVDYKKVPKLLENLLGRQRVMTPEELYKEFLEIHPFVDGNGRVAKVIYNTLKGTLDAPVMPPNFFGCSNP